MANVRILYNSATWDAATVTSSSETGDLVDGNIVDNQLGRVWRTTGKTAEWIKFQLAGATQITAFAMVGFNLTAAATVTLEAHASDSWVSPSYSQVLTVVTDSDGVVLPRLVLFLDQTYAWWRVTFADTGNPDGYIQVGRMMAGTYYSPTRNVSDGFSVETIDPSEGSARPGTLATYRTHNSYRRAAVDFSFANQTQADKLAAVFRRTGNRLPLVVSLDPTSRPTQESLYCRLDSSLQTVYAMTGQFHQGTLVFEEITE